MLKKYHLPTELYIQLLINSKAFDDQKTMDENKKFLDDLPYRLRIKTVMHIYQELYECVPFLNTQSENFLGWICPHLKQAFMPIEQYVYYESDTIEDIFFMVKGSSGYVLPFKENVVYIEIEPGDQFGEIDLVLQAA